MNLESVANLIIVIIGIGVLICLVGIGTVIANLLILRANQKMYTEYFKDRSMANRAKGDGK